MWVVDNYQGEENEIIVASLTRSNEEGNIGFMSSPERLNVLLSRARTGLVIIGDSETFLKSRGGKEIWTKFFDMIKRLGYFYEGLPVQCEQHNDAKNVVKVPEGFTRLCPDGGCSEPWFVSSHTLIDSADYLIGWLYSGAAMSCGIHTCPRKCHRRQGHNDLICLEKVQTTLPCGHSVGRACHRSKGSLDACAACKLAQRKATVDKVNDTRANDRQPTSPTPSWREQLGQAAPTTDNRDWRNGRSGSRSTNIFSTYCGPRRSTDTNKDGIFSKPKLQYSGRGRGSWRK